MNFPRFALLLLSLVLSLLFKSSLPYPCSGPSEPAESAKELSKTEAVKFSVKLPQEFNADFDDLTAVYLYGGHENLGQWNPQHGVLLKKLETLWTATVQLPINTRFNEISYRYFIGRRFLNQDPPLIHILKWESSSEPRRLMISDKSATVDKFGEINGHISISDGWLVDPALSEIRFSIFDKGAIEFFKSTDLLMSDFYRISLKVFKREGENEVSSDQNSIVSVAVINDEKRRLYRKQANEELLTEIYSADGRDLLSFRVQTSSIVEKMNFRFTIDDGQSKSILAVADISSLNRDASQGKISADLIDYNTKIVIGKLTVEYQIILAATSDVMKSCNMEKTFVKDWKRGPSLNVGHRGMGNSYTKSAKVGENTIKSFITAFESGADFVEFDAQLTKDEVPIIYHDLQICIEENKQLKEMPVKNLTLEELYTRPDIYHISALRKPEIFGKFTPVVDRQAEMSDPDSRAFPMLKDVFIATPTELGFNLEVKYPMWTMDGQFECENFFELNLYLDRILDVVFKYGMDRRIVFSSFSPEICIALKMKQNRYPVLFLTQGITKRYQSYMNPLTMSSEIAMEFALSEGFLGVSFHSDELLRNPVIIDQAKKNGLVSFVWGDDLDKTKNFEFMKQIGLDGVICDRIDEHISGKVSISSQK